jgi:hypothetical protein
MLAISTILLTTLAVVARGQQQEFTVCESTILGNGTVRWTGCTSNEVCVSNPYLETNATKPSVCLTASAPTCSGFMGRKCKDDKQCVDDPRDDCNPQFKGNYDCLGLCM